MNRGKLIWRDFLRFSPVGNRDYFEIKLFMLFLVLLIISIMAIIMGALNLQNQLNDRIIISSLLFFIIGITGVIAFLIYLFNKLYLIQGERADLYENGIRLKSGYYKSKYFVERLFLPFSDIKIIYLDLPSELALNKAKKETEKDMKWMRLKSNPIPESDVLATNLFLLRNSSFIVMNNGHEYEFDKSSIRDLERFIKLMKQKLAANQVIKDSR